MKTQELTKQQRKDLAWEECEKIVDPETNLQKEIKIINENQKELRKVLKYFQLEQGAGKELKLNKKSLEVYDAMVKVFDYNSEIGNVFTSTDKALPENEWMIFKEEGFIEDCWRGYFHCLFAVERRHIEFMRNILKELEKQ